MVDNLRTLRHSIKTYKFKMTCQIQSGFNRIQEFLNIFPSTELAQENWNRIQIILEYELPGQLITVC